MQPLSPSYFEFDRMLFWLHNVTKYPDFVHSVHKDDLSKDQLKGELVYAGFLQALMLVYTELLYEEVLSFVPSI